jgi:hypothetical protein
MVKHWLFILGIKYFLALRKWRAAEGDGGNVSMHIAIPERELLVQLEVIEFGIIL